MNLIYKLRNSIALEKITKVLVAISLALYIFTIPCFGESETASRYFVYISLILLTIFSILYAFLYNKFYFCKFLFIYLLFVIESFVGTLFFSQDFRRWLSILLLFLSSIVVFNVFNFFKKDFVLNCYLIALSLFCIIFIIVYRNDFANIKTILSSGTRLGSFFDNPNGISFTALSLYGVALYHLLINHKLYSVIPIFLSIMVGLSTGSRTFIILVGLVFLVVLYFVFKKRKLLYLLCLLFALALFIGILFLPFMETIRNKFLASIESIFGFGNLVDTSTISRFEYVFYAFELGSKSAFIGFGTNGFNVFSGVDTYSHNNYAEVFCSFGIIGFVLFYLPILMILIYCIKNRNSNKPLIVTLLVFIFIVGFTNVLYYKKLFFIIYSLIIFAYYEGRQKLKTNSINKIFFTCNTFENGGAENVIRVLSSEFAKKNIETKIIGISDLEEKSIDKFYEPLNEKNKIKRILKLRKKIKTEKPDFIISFLPHVNVYTSLAVFGLDIKHIVAERNNPLKNPKNLFLRIFKYLSFMSADGCVFQTEGSSKYFSFKIREKGIIIFNPISIQVKSKSLNKDKTIVCVGRLSEQKNQMLLINSFLKSELKNDYTLKIYGEGPLKNDISNFIKENKINNILLMGKSQNWLNEEINTSLFVLCSNFEGMPNALLEALSAGIPCVSTNCQFGPAEIANFGFSFTLVSNNSVNELTNGIETAVKKIDLKTQNNNVLLSKKMSPEIIANQWILFISSL